MSSSHILRALLLVIGLSLGTSALAQPSFGDNQQFRAVPTFHSLSIYWNPSGKGPTVTATVEYKVDGAPDTEYKRGLDLWYDERTPAPNGM